MRPDKGYLKRRWFVSVWSSVGWYSMIWYNMTSRVVFVISHGPEVWALSFLKGF